MRKFIIAIAFLLVFADLTGQSKFSPKWSANTKIQPDTLVIQVLSVEAFERTYANTNQVQILQTHTISGGIKLSVLDQKVINLWENDKNVRFIDIPGKPKEESALDDPDFVYNRVRLAQRHLSFDQPNLPIVSVKERRYDSADIDLVQKSRWIGLEANSSSQHATDMATIIGGRGNLSPKFLGVSPYVTLSSSDFANLFPDEESQMIDQNILIQNHSYGVGIENYYGAEAVAYDASVATFPELLHVYSAGNSGQLQPEDGAYAGLDFANLTGNFKQAKNVLTVAALDTTFSVSEFNSRGPAYDGRLKPELTAYGGRGSSDAAAMVSGAASIIHSLLDQKTTSTSGLIRSILLAGADDVGPEGIDYYTGYGSLNLENSTEIVHLDQFESIELERGASVQIPIEVPENIAHLRVAISWVDPPAEVNADQALVNDIDGVLRFDGNEWRPWVLSTQPSNNQLNRPPTRRIDRINNNELITVENPGAGTYQLYLDAIGIPKESQIVHIAWSMEEANYFNWVFPMTNDHLERDEASYIHWDESFANNTQGQLQLSYDSITWQDITNTPLAQRFLKINMPDTASAAWLRMNIGNDQYATGQFQIGESLKVKVSFNCDDRFGLEWEALKGATGYEIFQMGAEHMESIGFTESTQFTISKSGADFYAVAPQYGIYDGLRSQAFNYRFQGAFCYFNFFAAERTIEGNVRVGLVLSTMADIKSIEFLKSYNQVQNEVFNRIENVESTEYFFEDEELDPGLISYQAILYFEDGSSLASDLSEIFVEDESQAIFFPNPSDLEYINILSPGFGYRIDVIDRNGRVVLQKQLDGILDFIITRDFEAGLYLYRLMDSDESVVDTGKFIIR